MCRLRVLALAAMAPLATTAKDAPYGLVLRVVDGGHVPAVTLQRAIGRVDWVFRAAGILPKWLPTCSVDSAADMPQRVGCGPQAPDASSVLEICILGPAGVAPNMKANVLGLANVAVRRAYVLWYRIQGSELGKAVSDEKALAMVMLHEAGHAAGLQHSPSGVMRADLCPETGRGSLNGIPTFTPAEAGQIRRMMNEGATHVVRRNVEDEIGKF
jgi:hypothetical protein